MLFPVFATTCAQPLFSNSADGTKQQEDEETNKDNKRRRVTEEEDEEECDDEDDDVEDREGDSREVR